MNKTQRHTLLVPGTARKGGGRAEGPGVSPPRWRARE